MDNTQVQAPEPTNLPQANVQAPEPTNGVLPADLSQYVAEPTPNQTPTGTQGQSDGQPTPTPAAIPDPNVAELQRLLNQRQIENYQLQQQLAMRSQQQQTQAPPPTENPYDPSTQGAQWIQWENRKTAELTAQNVLNGVMNYASEQARITNERQWMMSHPGVDVNMVKGFAQARWGVRDVSPDMLNDALTLLNLPNTIAATQRNTAQNALNQFTQPQTGAIPIRGGATGAGTPAELSYEKLATAYQNTNGSVYNSWPKELQTAFDRETAIREYNSRQPHR